MALFNVIEYEGDNTTFVWKHPKTDFNTHSQLVVHQSQEAVLFKNGQALDLFTAGRYTLETQNIPLLRRVINIPTGGKSPFHCEVYFINKTQQMAIKWGTDSRVQYMDPKYNFPLTIGASGEMSLSVSDSRRLLVKLVGTETVLTQKGLVAMFRGLLMSKIKPYLSSVMQSSRYTIFDADAHMGEYSSELKSSLVPDFDEYGLSLDKFFVTTIVPPEDDEQYQRFKELHFRSFADVAEARLQQQIGIISQETEARKTVIQAEAEAKKRAAEGYTYQQEKAFEVAKEVAGNEASGSMTNLGVGLGMMGSVAGAFGGVMNSALDGISSANTAGGSAGSPQPSQAQPAGKESIEDFRLKVEKLKLMHDSGLLSDEEFAAAKAELLKNI